jgi:hypothetical protein
MGGPIRLLGVLAACVVACIGVAVSPSAAAPATRHTVVALSPSTGDLTLAELRFSHAGRHSVSADSLRIAAPSVFGADYLAVARVRGHVALALLANRATQLDDPSTVRLQLRSAPSLGQLQALRLTDPITHPPTYPPSWLCELVHDGAVDTMSAIYHHGAPLAGLAPTAAIDEAVRLTCGLPFLLTFENAIAGCSSSCEQPAPIPAPLPTPTPTPEPPKCAPCDPKPGVACPLAVAVPAYCVAGRDEAPAAAH